MRKDTNLHRLETCVDAQADPSSYCEDGGQGLRAGKWSAA